MTPLTIPEIIAHVAAEFDVTPWQIIDPNRSPRFTRPRFAAYTIAQEAGYSLTQIGHGIGGRDHTTVMSGIRRAVIIAAHDPAYSASLKRLRANLIGPVRFYHQQNFRSIRADTACNVTP